MTSLTTSHPTNTTAATTPESTPRQGRPDITARWTRWVLVGTVSVGLVGAAAGLGFRTYEHSHAATGTESSSGSTLGVDPDEFVHGGGGSIRTGTGALVSGLPQNAAVVSDTAQMVHGTRGSLADAAGQPVVSR